MIFQELENTEVGCTAYSAYKQNTPPPLHENLLYPLLEHKYVSSYFALWGWGVSTGGSVKGQDGSQDHGSIRISKLQATKVMRLGG